MAEGAGAPAEAPSAPRYWAFISYSHADEAWARWLHRALESYRVPARLVGQSRPEGPLPRRLFPVFRDRDELPGSAELGPELQKALRASRTQIVICSPRAAQSRWVEEEIRYFKSLGPAQRVLALIVDGEPHAADAAAECFPAALKVQIGADGQPTGVATEPIAADARPAGDGRDNARLKLIAGILGVGFNDLKQRELVARNRRLAAAAGVSSMVAAVTVVLAVLAVQARNDAQRRQQQAEDLIEFMLGDLRDKLEPIGKLAILDAVGAKAMAYFATLEARDQTDAALGARAKALRQIGHVRLQQGNLAGAADAFGQALTLDSELVQRHPDDVRSIYNVGESQYSVGYAHYTRGEIEQALPWWDRYAETSRRLAALEPANDKWHKQVAEAHSNIGAALYRRGELPRARSYFEQARGAQQLLVDRQPADETFVATLATIHGWLYAVANEAGGWDEALAEAQRQLALQRRLTELAPDNAGYRYRLAAAAVRTIHAASRVAPVAPDDARMHEALALADELVALDPQNVEYARVRQAALTELERTLLAQQSLARAAQVNRDALALSRDIWRRAPDKAEAVDELLSAFARGAKIAWLQQDAERASRLLQDAFALPLSADQVARSQPSRWLDLQLLGWSLAPDTAQREIYARRAADWLQRLGSKDPSPALLLRYAALKGDRAEAQRWAGALPAAERSDLFLLQFCRRLALCEVPG